MTIEVEQKAVNALRDWLLLKLPGRVTTINAARAATLRAPLAGPYTVPASARLYHSSATVQGSFTEVSGFTAGSRTAAQIATDFNATVPGVASADSTGRLLFTAAAAPSSGVDSVVALGPDVTGMMAALGFDAGGEEAITTALVAPGVRGIVDGTPIGAPDMGAGFWVMIGDVLALPVEPAVRRDEYLVGMSVALLVPVPMAERHRSREHLRAAKRAVREALFLEDGGRTLGNSSNIQLVTERQALEKARVVEFKELPNAFFSRAAIELNVRVFERQAD